MHLHVILAIFRRNFVSYLINPTGYVFICVFVLLSGLAAFWPQEFFNANLANLNQLNKYLPYIMLVFVPAITMGVWAEERRQGTDELLLTIPAADIDVVLGKYLAAVAIFSISLAFSAVADFITLSRLGSPDIGLFTANYIGYWELGLAMLAVGMVASFLTNNLTVGFILGAVFNAPLVFAVWSEVVINFVTQIVPETWGWQPALQSLGRGLKSSSYSSFLEDSSRGVISLASLCFFGMLVAVMLYLSMVLIGRRHWQGGKEGKQMTVHYLARVLCLGLVMTGVGLTLSHRDLIRLDLTEERLSSLSPSTRKLLRELDANKPVLIEAFVSPNVPERYEPMRLNLLSMLREFSSVSNGKVQTRIYDTESSNDAGILAEREHGITSKTVQSSTRGLRKEEEIYMGVVISQGLKKVRLPFIDRGIPLEYELHRSVGTVSGGESKTIGVLKTAAGLMSPSNPMMGAASQQLIIDELKKQYKVIEVDPSRPITDTFDVLLAVQPSSLDPESLRNFLNFVRSGKPTAIFEDPMPANSGVPGTNDPAAGGGFGMPPQPKGDVDELWDMLAVTFNPMIIGQKYNPYPQLQNQIPEEIVFITSKSGNLKSFNPDSGITSGLDQVAILFGGSFERKPTSKLVFTPLMVTAADITEESESQQVRMLLQTSQEPKSSEGFRKLVKDERVMAAHIKGNVDASSELMSDEGSPLLAMAAQADEESEAGDGEPSAEEGALADEGAAPTGPEGSADGGSDQVNVVLVADMDLIGNGFFQLRAVGADDEAGLDINLDNITFVLNVLDYLADDERFIEVRKRRIAHRTLTTVEEEFSKAQSAADAAISEAQEGLENEVLKARTELEQEVEAETKNITNPTEQLQRRQILVQTKESELNAKLQKFQSDLSATLKLINRDLERTTNGIQDSYKVVSVLLRPLLPLMIGLAVFFFRRSREQMGVESSRLR